MTDNPWDVQPLSTLDDDDLALYTSIGRALSAWESLEYQLSSFFSFFATDGQDINSFPATRAYGTVVSFRGRYEMLRESAAAYFAARPDKEFSGRFGELLKLADKASCRRNEIAHGIVGQLIDKDTEFGWALVPPEYASNKHTIVPKSAHAALEIRRRYKYSSREIDAYRTGFRALELQLLALIGDWSRERISSPVPYF